MLAADVPVDVSLQSRATAIRQPAAIFAPSGQYLLSKVGALSTDIGLQRVAAVATMGEQQVAVKEVSLGLPVLYAACPACARTN